MPEQKVLRGVLGPSISISRELVRIANSQTLRWGEDKGLAVIQFKKTSR
jgi:hypothetical protein